MNTNTNNSQSPCKVTSQYFSSNHAMDESLSDFKEKKKGIAGPKNLQKAGASKPKSKKPSKRIKGQKDIRAVLKPKKNELLSYTEEFDVVCKQSGIDIDSEQLQLAVALSKSLQPTKSETCDTQSAFSLSSQQRSGKIRKTLQQYGFSVPEIKVSKSTKRFKKCRKDYKLLVSTDSEKKQIICNKYSQVLFENVSFIGTEEKFYLPSTNLYYLGTNALYKTMQNNDILYVDNLLEKSTSKGNLLRDWAEIPGRPKSPKAYEAFNMNFSEIECSQEELDTILSGSIKSAKEIIKKKVKLMPNESPIIVIDDFDHDDPQTGSDTKSEQELVKSSNKADNCSENTKLTSNINVVELNISDIGKSNKLTVESMSRSSSASTTKVRTSLASRETLRSCSPDIFDDEESDILDNSKENADKIYQELIDDIVDSQCNSIGKKKVKQNVLLDLTQDESTDVNISSKTYFEHGISNVTKRKSNIYVETTECVSKCNTIHKDQMTHISQVYNLTTRKSNDFMEITNCVDLIQNDSHIPADTYNNVFSSDVNSQSQVAHKTRRLSNDFMEITNCIGSTSEQKNLCIEANIDLTQNSYEDRVPKTTVVDAVVNSKIDYIDISQSSNSNDELLFICVSGNNMSLDDTIILDNNEIDYAIAKSSVSVKKNKPECENKEIVNTGTLDLTQALSSPVDSNSICNKSSQSFFDEFVHDHSDNTKETIEKSFTSQENASKSSNPNTEVDLTQTSNSSDALINENKTSCNSGVLDRSSLGKKDDISIDYDDLYDEMVHNSKTGSINNNSNSTVHDKDHEKSISHRKTASETSSQNSEVFAVCDQELEYSINKSTHGTGWDNYGDISIMDNISKVVKSRHSDIDFVNKETVVNYTMHRSMTDSFLPTVDKLCKSTPLRNCVIENSSIVKTPGNSEYVVKTDQVTPMLDYASMLTPERNKELNKYGLKTFKRKRAIQLLTHIYNQTHPVIEALPEDLPSPSKKRKHNLPSPKDHINKLYIENQPTTSKPKNLNIDNEFSIENRPILSIECNKENGNIFEVTKALPDLRDIQCEEDDWVFQKREKAKVHSCRVPLHIAFHNYVSCRRKLREAILRYEPVNIDVIHKELVASGHRYDPKDLLKFMDKKCITVKSADNNARNNRK